MLGQMKKIVDRNLNRGLLHSETVAPIYKSTEDSIDIKRHFNDNKLESDSYFEVCVLD